MPNINKHTPLPASPPSISPQAASQNTSQPSITPRLESSAQHTLDVTEQKQSKAATSISLDLDDSKPGAPDKTQIENRYPDRGRSISIPLLHADQHRINPVNPLPASGLHKNEDGLVLENTATRPDQIFASIDAPSQMIAALVDELSNKYPKLEQSVLYRLAVAATYVAVDIPLMVAAHEMGHGSEVQHADPSSNPEVVMTGWMGGYTRYNLAENTSDLESLMITVAGMNQATYNGEEIQRRMHTEGADLKDAIGYLVNITNSVNYQIKDWAQKNPAGFDDAASYHAVMEARDKGWNQQNLSMLSLGVNLINADFWASLIGSVNYIATGEQVRMPEIQMGQNHLSLPHFSITHGYEGPQMNVSVFGHRNTPATLELKYAQILTPDNGPALGIETRLHNLAIPGTQKQLSMSPRIGFSTHNQSLGFKAGTGLEFRPHNNPHIALTAGFDYRHHYLPDNYLSGLDGIQVDSGLKLSF